MGKTSEVLNRTAKTGGESEVASVHINSWKEAYKGLLPQTFLDQLHLTFERRVGWWQKVIATAAHRRN